MSDERARDNVSPSELTERTGSERSRAEGRATLLDGERRLRCLVTNDDGIGSEGLRRLALMAADAGMDVVVAGPARDYSGASASITAATADGRFEVEPRDLLGLDGHQAYAVSGLPAFIALTGCRGAFGQPPDIVLSGINVGQNTGHAILHSGTVGAALTASTHGMRAMAVSLSAGLAPHSLSVGDASSEPHWDTAVAYARELLPVLVASPPGTVLNLNVPDTAADEVRGLVRARLANFGAVQTNVLERGKGYVKMGISEIDPTTEPDSDAALLAAGYATITSLKPVCEADGVELPGLAAHLEAARA